MKMAQDQRKVLLGKPAAVIDDCAGGEGLDPRSEAIARRAKFGIGGVIKGAHIITQAGLLSSATE